MDEIILIGAGGHSRSCMDVIEMSGQYKIAGLVEKNNADIQENFDYSVIGNDDDLLRLRGKYRNALVTVGQIQSSVTRVKLFRSLKEMDYNLPVIISPSAYVSKYAKIGNGTIVMHGAIVNSNAVIGENCIINNKVLIEHDTNIGDHCHVATGAIVNGGVGIGSASFIGSGVVTKQGITIGNNCIVGAGVILKYNIKSKQIIKN